MKDAFATLSDFFESYRMTNEEALNCRFAI